MKSDKIRFRILKILKDFPTHGYNLFLILSKEGLVKNASELYKILRTFNKKGLIAGKGSKSPQGPNRTIFFLTDKGFEEYYSQVIDSANNFFDLMIEANSTTIVEAIKEGTKKLNFDIEKIENKKIFIDSFQLVHRLQSNLIHKLLIPLKGKNQVYLQSKVMNEHELIYFKDSILDIKILDENLSIKPHMMDIIFAFGLTAKDPFENHINHMLEILKNNGILFLFIRRRENVREPKIFRVFINDLFKNVPEKHHKKLQQIVPFHHSTDSTEIPLEDGEIKELLLKYFENVELLSLPAFLSVILAKKPKF
ncbi:MAG: PadR family transcriptional regulator [Candidatus Helarchaeota archaeon]